MIAIRGLLSTLVLAMAALPSFGQTVTVTQKGEGYRVTRNGATISTHATERKAWETALNAGPGTYLIYPPPLEIVVKAPIAVQSVSCFGYIGKPPACPPITAAAQVK